MISSDQFLPFIHPEVPKVPRGFILQYIMEALQSIYKIQGTTIEHLSPMVLRNDQDFVVLNEQYYADEVACVLLNGNPVPPLPETCHSIPASVCGQRAWYLAGDEDQTGGDQLWFQGVGKRNTTRPKSVCVTIDHKELSANRVPDYIFRDYKMAVKHFVLWQLMEMIDKPWSNYRVAIETHRHQWYIERRTIKANAMLRLYAGRPRAIIPINDFSTAGRGSTFGSFGLNRTFAGGGL